VNKILVVCFSRTGSTRTAARALAAQLDADFEELRAAPSFEGAGGFLRAVIHSIRRATPRIDLAVNPRSDALSVLAAPVWASRLASPMRSYLVKHGHQIRAAAALSVSARGGEFPQVFDEIEQLTGNPLRARIGLAQGQANGPALGEALKSFAERVQAAAETAPAAAVRPGSHAA